MIRHGKAPFLECSSLGDKRFSAVCASLDGLTIETRYQAAKKFEDGSTGLHWRAAKGCVPVNIKEVQKLYSELWDRYIAVHPELQRVLMVAKGLSDTFGQEGHACQATELWRIRAALIKKKRKRK